MRVALLVPLHSEVTVDKQEEVTESSFSISADSFLDLTQVLNKTVKCTVFIKKFLSS